MTCAQVIFEDCHNPNIYYFFVPYTGMKLVSSGAEREIYSIVIDELGLYYTLFEEQV